MFVSSKEAQKFYNVSPETLRLWAEKGEIEYQKTKGGHRRYKIINRNKKPGCRKSYIYARVSSKKQEKDLKSQIKFLQEKYPKHKVLSDIGSGINTRRKKFKTLLDRLLDGNVEEIVVAHKDRLSRFNFDIIQFICKKLGTRLIVVNEEREKEPNEELAEDLMSIVTVFSARYHGRRKY